MADIKTRQRNTKGFSLSNLNYMKRVYELFKPLGNSYFQVDGEIDHQLDGGFDLNGLFCVPWGHLKLLADKCKGNTDKALFFVKEIEQSLKG